MTYVRRMLVAAAACVVLLVAAAPGDAACPGDCNNDLVVSVDELVVGINIALGRQPVAACSAMDANSDGAVRINEIVLAVDASLNECPDSCGGNGECTPGATRSESCGFCGTQSFQCDAACRWRPSGECADPGECAPGMREERTCGTCGSRSRTCSSSCDWGSFGQCSNEGGECTPGQMQEQSCGGHPQNKRRRTCTNACGWPAFGSCSCPGILPMFNQCSSCPSGFHVAEVFGPTCGGGPFAPRAHTCSPNCGPFFDACGTTCPPGYTLVRSYETGRCSYNSFDPGLAVACRLN